MRWTRKAWVKTAIPSPSLGTVVGKPLVPPSLFRAGRGRTGIPIPVSGRLPWDAGDSESWESAGISPADPPRVVSLEEPELRLEHCIEFVVRGNPPPTLHWLHNGQPLRESKITHVEYYQEGEVSEGCLLFNKPTHYNNGNYTLIAKNPLGTANQTINGHFLKEPFPGEGGAAFREHAGRGSDRRHSVSLHTATSGHRLTRGRVQPPPAF